MTQFISFTSVSKTDGKMQSLNSRAVNTIAPQTALVKMPKCMATQLQGQKQCSVMGLDTFSVIPLERRACIILLLYF